MTRTALYRHFDGNGRLLYVGVSLSALTRLAQHATTAKWFGDIRRVDIEWHASRRLALAAESRAIKIEAPVFNAVRPSVPARLDCVTGILNPRTGRIDGWYSNYIESLHMLGFWRAIFPTEEFCITYPKEIGGNYLYEGIRLFIGNWKVWTNEPPDYAAGDRYDDQTTQAEI